jgi:hypothetical protein
MYSMARKSEGIHTVRRFFLFLLVFSLTSCSTVLYSPQHIARVLPTTEDAQQLYEEFGNMRFDSDDASIWRLNWTAHTNDISRSKVLGVRLYLYSSTFEARRRIRDILYGDASNVSWHRVRMTNKEDAGEMIAHTQPTGQFLAVKIRKSNVIFYAKLYDYAAEVKQEDLVAFAESAARRLAVE